MFLQLLAKFILVSFLNQSVFSALDSGFESSINLDGIRLGALGSYQISQSNQKISVQAADMDWLGYGIRMKYLGSTTQRLVITKGSVTVNDEQVCKDAEGKEPTYQKTKDGTIWFTNCNVGEPSSKKERKNFNKKVADFKREKEEQIKRWKESLQKATDEKMGLSDEGFKTVSPISWMFDNKISDRNPPEKDKDNGIDKADEALISFNSISSSSNNSGLYQSSGKNNKNDNNYLQGDETGDSNGGDVHEANHGADYDDDHGADHDDNHNANHDDNYGADHDDNYGADHDVIYGANYDDNYGADHDDNYGADHDDNYGADHDDNHGADHDDNYGADHDDNHGADHDDNYGADHDDNYGADHDDNHGADHDDNYGADHYDNHGADHDENNDADHDDNHEDKDYQSDSHAADDQGNDQNNDYIDDYGEDHLTNDESET